jgi:sulfatase modifying factor 1
MKEIDMRIRTVNGLAGAAALGLALSCLPGAAVDHKAGDIWAKDSIVGNLRYVLPTGPQGFLQGSPAKEYNRNVDEKQFRHILTRGLAVMETELTQKMWKALRAAQPTLPNLVCHFKDDDKPVESVTWFEAVLYANLLSKLRKRNPCYFTDATKANAIDASNYLDNIDLYCDFDANGFRLPFEGEWEYFTRAGTKTPFWIAEPKWGKVPGATCTKGDLPSLEKAAYFCANSPDVYAPQTQKVGRKLPNPWKLRDVHGNVHEWCWDWSWAYPKGTVTNYTGPKTVIGIRVYRGGSVSITPNGVRSASRRDDLPSSRCVYSWVGFRLVRTVKKSS